MVYKRPLSVRFTIPAWIATAEDLIVDGKEVICQVVGCGSIAIVDEIFEYEELCRDHYTEALEDRHTEAVIDYYRGD